VIRGWIGHADLSTTNRYAEINTRTKLAALRATELPGTSAGSRTTPVLALRPSAAQLALITLRNYVPQAGAARPLTPAPSRTTTPVCPPRGT
jgi:hypothetical protein